MTSLAEWIASKLRVRPDRGYTVCYGCGEPLRREDAVPYLPSDDALHGDMAYLHPACLRSGPGES